MTENQQVLLTQYLEIRGCRIKAVFKNRGEAKKEAKRMTQINRNGRIRAYKCKYCPNYHIGHVKVTKAKKFNLANA